MLKNRAAIVTGGATGLGKAVVEAFVNQGGKVFFTYLKSKEKAEELMKKYPNSVQGYQVNAIDYIAVEEAVNKAIAYYGIIDILVNNVAATKGGTILSTTYDGWDYTIKNTLYSTFNYTRAICEHFRNNKYGKIINVGSVNGLRGREGNLAYASAKSALIGFTKTVAKELGEYNVTANVIAPGYIDTEAQTNTSPLIKKLVLDECAIRKLTTPEEVAELILFMASSKSDSITGQVYIIDRGQSL